MNPGDLEHKVEVLTLTNTGNIYNWVTTANIWAKVERLNGTNIFSKVGIGAKSIKFTIRRRELTLHNAFRWEGKHYFLTDIVNLDRMYYEVTAAIIEPKTCIVERTGEPILNELNRPIYGDPVILTFPAYLTEKYLGYTQGTPMGTTEIRYILVTPKAIELDIGELVNIDGTIYNVEIIHSLDNYKNEYEIVARSDA